jgi:choline dehydrogenase-like flavoprotein
MAREKTYDVILVGTGAGGGLVAHVLATQGVEVLNLEYGPSVPTDDLGSFEMFYEAYRRLPYAELYRSIFEPGPESWKRSKYFIYPEECDYKTEGKGWYWRRYRNVGGRSTWWAAVSPRLSPQDFTAGSSDGYGPDWPLTYQDLEPYYDWLDINLGNAGPDVGHPECPKGIFQRPARLRCGERVLQDAVYSKLIHDFPLMQCEPIRKMIATQEMGPGRSPCYYHGACWEGCKVGARFDAAQLLIAPALRLPNYTLRTNAVVAEVLVDKNTGKATGVRYVDRVSKQSYEAHAKVVVVAASAIETARILLNSKSSLYPAGVANSNQHVGKHLVEQIRCLANAFVEQLYGMKPLNDDGYGGNIYMPRFTRTYQDKIGFIRGYEVRAGSGKGIDGKIPGFGAALKAGIKDHYQSILFLEGFGEKLDNPGTYVEIDPSGKVDVYGIPIVRIHSALHENDMMIFRDMQDKLRLMLEASGGQHVHVDPVPPTPGISEHESGTCRMGKDPKESVCNGFGQTHEVKNLFIGDSSVFTQATEKSPTITIMALAMRSADYLVEELRRGNL